MWLQHPSFGDGMAASEGVAVAEGLVFAGGADNSIHALRTRDLTVSWYRRLNAPTNEATPAYADGRLFVSTGSAIYAFDASDGTQLWSRFVSCGASPNLLVMGSGLYVGGCEVVRVSAATGQTEWVADDLVCYVRCHIASDGSRLFVPTRTGLTAVDVSTGAELWSFATGPQSHPVQFVSHRNGAVYFGTSGAGSPAEDEVLYAFHKLDAATGAVVWRVDTGIVGPNSSLVLAGDHLIARTAAGSENYLMSLKEQDGTFEWQTRLGSDQCTICPSPIVIGDTIWVAGADFGPMPMPRGIPETLHAFRASDGLPVSAAVPQRVVYGLGTPAFDGKNFYVPFRSGADGFGGGVWIASFLTEGVPS
jgi:outer membrane protein assembly factor BamB